MKRRTERAQARRYKTTLNKINNRYRRYRNRQGFVSMSEDIEFWKHMETELLYKIATGNIEQIYIQSAKNLAQYCRKKAAEEVATKLRGDATVDTWAEQDGAYYVRSGKS